MRDIGSAVAVLSLYLLTLLLPLHQTAALQRDMAAVDGIATLSVLCGIPASPDEGGDRGGSDVPALKCPAAGIGKNEFAALLPSLAALPVAPRTVARAWQPRLAALSPATRPEHVGQPRAPPATA